MSEPVNIKLWGPGAAESRIARPRFPGRAGIATRVRPSAGAVTHGRSSVPIPPNHGAFNAFAIRSSALASVSLLTANEKRMCPGAPKPVPGTPATPAFSSSSSANA